LWGEDDPDVLDQVRALEMVLEKFGMVEQLNQMHEKSKGVWERLEDELKGRSPAVYTSL
jgi:hypothetical protein